MTDDVTVETVWMKDTDTVQDHFKFEPDSSGRPLLYKILIRNNAVFAFLYNDIVTAFEVIEIPFVEKKLKQGDLVKIHDENIFGENIVIAKIEKIPFSMCDARDKSELKKVKDGDVCNYEMMSFCGNRYFERLPGLIDLRILSSDNGTSLYEGDYLIALPIC
jgi:hypothetical protein